MSKMCKKDKEDKKVKKDDAAFECKKCGSRASKEKKLCKPEKLK